MQCNSKMPEISFVLDDVFITSTEIEIKANRKSTNGIAQLKLLVEMKSEKNILSILISVFSVGKIIGNGKSAKQEKQLFHLYGIKNVYFKFKAICR